jgi:hypothetical protein
MEKGQGRRTKKNEGRNHKHQEDVLDHVDGEGSFVEGRKRRANRDPEREHTREKSAERRWWKQIAGRNVVKGRFYFLPVEIGLRACALWIATERTVKHIFTRH